MPEELRCGLTSLYKVAKSLEGIASGATSWQVAGGCASAIADALEARAVVIHHHDPVASELRSIGAHGPKSGDLLGGTMKADDDLVVTVVLTNERPLMLRIDGALPRFIAERHRLLEASRSIDVVPIVGGGGCVAVIEIIDVGEGREEHVLKACELVAQRLRAVLAGAETRAPEEDPTPIFPKAPATLVAP
jgi:hypothetical protein